MDEAAIRHQLAEHHLAGYGWALHCCARNPAQAEDVLQTVYLKILQGKARFDGRSSFKTWLFGVIRLTAAQERRRDWLRRLKLLRYEPEPPTPSRDTEEQRLLQQALAALPHRQREVLHLVFYQDLTIEEAGSVMGVSLGSARTHYERGKQRLRALLVNHEIGIGRSTTPATLH